MNPKQKNSENSSPFYHLNRLDDPALIQYLENYYSLIQKKERQNLQRQKTINFFIEEDQDANYSNRNVYESNLVNPSLSVLQFKESEDFTVNYQDEMVGEQSIEKQNNSKFYNLKHEQSQNNRGREQSMDIEYDLLLVNTQQNIPNTILVDPISLEEYDTKNPWRSSRINSILNQVSSIKFQLEQMIEYFQNNIKLDETQLPVQSQKDLNEFQNQNEVNFANTQNNYAFQSQKLICLRKKGSKKY